MDTIQAVKERRSINFFEPGKTLAEHTLNELLSIANLAPSSFDLQPWKIVAVREHARKKALRECAMNQQKVEDASAVLIVLADPAAVEENKDRVLESWQSLGYLKPEMRSAYAEMIDSLYGTKESLTRKIFASKNAALFAMNLMLAAKGMGLETHPMDGFDEACVKREFHIPDDKIVIMLIAIGLLKTGAKLLPRAFRRELDEFVKHEDYERK